MVAGYYKYDTSSGTVDVYTTSTESVTHVVFVTNDTSPPDDDSQLLEGLQPKDEAEANEGIGHRWPVEIDAKHNLAKPFYRINQLESGYG